MPPIRAAKYSADQREAVALAYVDRDLKPKEIVRQAAAGELTLNGQPLPPFTMNPGSVATYGRALTKKRRGKDTGEMADLPPRDAVEVLRRRLVQMADQESEAMRRVKAGQRDTVRMAQIARAVREIAALPGPAEPRPPAPGAKVNGQQLGGQTRGGQAGALLREHRTEHGRAQPPADEPNPTEPHTQERDHTTTHTHHHAAQHHTTQEPPDDGTPGSVVRALAARIGVPGGVV